MGKGRNFLFSEGRRIKLSCTGRGEEGSEFHPYLDEGGE